MSRKSNVFALMPDARTAEDLLRNALSECAETRSRGEIPKILVMIVDEQPVPGLFYTRMSIKEFSACSQIASYLADSAIREFRDQI